MTKRMLQLSLSIWLVLGFLLVVAITSTISAFVGAWMIGSGLAKQAQEKAEHDINTAQLVYNQALDRISSEVHLASLSPEIQTALESGDRETLTSQLRRFMKRGDLDFVTLSSPDGRVLGRAHATSHGKNSQAGERIVRATSTSKRPVAGVLILSRDDLLTEGMGLADRARLHVLDAGGNPSGPHSELTSGLVLIATAMVTRNNNGFIGVVYGGRLLNRTNDVVDLIHQTIYKGEVFQGKEIGQATIFLGDIRIATNLRLPGGARALGTRVDRAVSNYVLRRGIPWVAQAFVLGELHITAYRPVRDISKRVVGILAVGIPEQKYTVMRKKTLFIFFGISLVGVILAIGIAAFISRRIGRSIRNITEAVRDLAKGDMDRRVEPVVGIQGIQEFQHVSELFNMMAASLKERDLQLKYRTQEQIGKAERLAMIGRLAAGVAHEINNPLGGIMLFSNLLLRKLPQEGPLRENARRICHEAERCQKIVQGLLDFARHREPKVESIEIHNILDKTLQLFEEQAMFLNIETIKDYQEDIRPVRVDPSQMEQVFMNLIFNAAEAMKGEGKLTISTKSIENGNAMRIDISDTGCGIVEENLEHLFEPFFSTKGVGEGTGLGLSITRGIVENHGGTIWASSTVGKGTTFSIRLPTPPT